MPLNDKSKTLVNSWAALFAEYFDRAGISEPICPFYAEQGLEPSIENQVAVRSRKEIFTQTVGLKRALSLENSDLTDALKISLPERIDYIREKPDMYLNNILDDFLHVLDWVEHPPVVAPIELTEVEKKAEADRLELEAAFAQLTKTAALSPVSEEGKRPGQTPEKEAGGQAPEQSR